MRRSGAPRRRAGVHAAVEHELAVDGHVLESLCEAARLLVGGEVVHGIGVEDRDVGRHARSHEAAVGEAEALRGQRGHVAHALRQAEHAELAHVDGEVARERPPAARVRPLADEDAVAAGGVARGAASIARTFSSLPKCTSAEAESPRVGAALAVDVDRPLALARREVGDRHAVEHDRVPLDRHVVEAVGARLLELDAQALAQVGVAQPRDRRLGPAGVRPAGQQRVQVRGAREIRDRCRA